MDLTPPGPYTVCQPFLETRLADKPTRLRDAGRGAGLGAAALESLLPLELDAGLPLRLPLRVRARAASRWSSRGRGVCAFVFLFILVSRGRREI